MRINQLLLVALVAAVQALPAYGQAVPSREPTSTHIFPAGGRRGTVVKVRVGGECLPPGMNFHVFGDGVTGPSILGPASKARYEPSLRRLPRDADGVGANMAYPREFDATLTLAANAEPGPRFWRVTGGWGGTQLRPFLVGDLPEFIETEPNSQPERAERITLPVVVNGQIAGERDQDYFVFAAQAGDVVVCDVLAARIGSPLDPVVAVLDSRGRRLETDETRVGNDPVIACRIPATGDYRLHVANLGFQGGPAYVYRITVSTAPYAPFAFPPGGHAGATHDLEVFTLTGGGALHAAKEKIAFPANPGPFTVRGHLPLIAGARPEVVAVGANRSSATAMELTPHAPPLSKGGPEGVTVNARFLTAQEEGWYRFQAKQGATYTIACQPGSRDSAAVPILTLFDAKGTPLAKASAVETADHAAELTWKAPADGAYRLCVRDLQHGARGGPEFIYRLTVRPAQPDFALRLGADYVNVVQGGRTEIDLFVQRTGGFTGPIDLTAAGLPDGVKIEPTRIADGQTKVKLAVVAKDDVRPTSVALNLLGRAAVTPPSPPFEGGDTGGVRRVVVSSFEWAGLALHLTVQHKPVFRLTCNEAYQYAHRGTIYPYLMQVERMHGFTGPITLQLCDRQVQDLDGIEIVETVIPPGAKEAKNLIYLPETMHSSVQHHCRPYAQGYATFTDKWGQAQTLLAVCDKRCIIRTLPPIVKLRAATPALSARPGDHITCKLILDRTSNFTGPAELELIESQGFTASKVTLAANQLDATLNVHIGSHLRAHREHTLRFRATGSLPSGATVITEASVVILWK